MSLFKQGGGHGQDQPAPAADASRATVSAADESRATVSAADASRATVSAPDAEVTEVTAAAESAEAGAPASSSPAVRMPFTVPYPLRQFGLASWLVIGLAIVALAVLALTGALFTLFVPTLFAALLGATFMPVADWLERKGMKRWLAALLTMILIVMIFAVVVLIVVLGVFKQFPQVQQNIDAATADVSRWLRDHNVQISTAQIKSSFQKAGPALIEGAFAAALQGIQGISTFVFGLFIGVNILVYFLADGRGIGRWMSFHSGPVPQPVAYSILANAARFLRGYIWGSTLIGLFNGAVMLVGAVVLGVPLAGTIAIVSWFTNYIPMFGAIIGGAFAVLIALASGGVTTAILMLVFVLIANGPLQTVVSQFALGAALKLHPLAVLFVTTAGAILFGALGGIVAAPLLKIALDTGRQLKEAGLFDEPEDGSRGLLWWQRGGRGAAGAEAQPGVPGPPGEPAADAPAGVVSGSTPGTP
jgi:predicted PurR-regulated permease PerM